MARDPEPRPPEPFAGFGPEGFAFLRELDAEQNRDWFLAHKPVYERSLLSPMAALLAELSNALDERDIPLRADPKRSVFRIHRDVRFSKDKRPYKTHVGATLTRDGEKLNPGVLYIHVDPSGCFVACGFYQPERRALDAIRGEIAARPAAWRHALGVAAADGLALAPDADALKRTPRGHEGVTDPDLTEALRRKSMVFRRDLTRESVGRRDLVERVVDFADTAAPLLRFGWSALDD